MYRRLAFLLAALAPGLAPGLAYADSVSVAVAANFVAPMHDIARQFERDTGHKVSVVAGSTGKFYAQIIHGAPFQVLLAADAATPARLEQAGAAQIGTRFTYAVGKLVLWSARSGLVDGQGAVLGQGGSAFSHLALANPKLAPYGAAALQTLHSLGRYDALKAKLVQGENIAQAYQFVASGNAQLGFVAYSQVLVLGNGKFNGKLKAGSLWMVPASLHSPIRQDAILLNQGRGQPGAEALMRYLQSEKIKTLIRSYGYDA
jgi:molybdate transport system substrate-binding protein